ncbi:MAG: DNA mismatch repair endonuclease MutL [Myxococcales bacterium]|nr:DNA mismatch repair endonuclease MutL [Myxococcales bacterium]
MDSAPRIARLDARLIDQIAAGEVVERPASVVKELVENAFDAGATRVSVALRDGGKALIAVSDDGLGMTAEQAPLALERHATSKLRVSEDLQRIASCGFRGEALPAIASVSQLRLETRARGMPDGCELRVSYGRLVSERVAGCTEGTRVEVAELFGAIPARRKFLKSATTEWGHVADLLQRLALSRPDVHLEVQRDGRPVFRWPAVDSPADRVAAVLPERDASAMVAVSHELGGYAVRGFASRPDVHRATAAGVHCFVNRRPVRDRVLRSAVVAAYRDWLPRGRYPTVVLYFEIPPDSVDVNVHPAKSEVRFVDPQAIHRLAREALRSAVAERSWLRGEERESALRVEDGELARSPGNASASWGSPTAGAGGSAGSEPRGGFGGRDDWLFANRVAEGPTRDDASAAMRFSELRCLGQIMSTYLVLEDKGALLLVDQHAAHERVLYERLRADWLRDGVPRQTLLLAVQVELSAEVASALEEHRETTERLGFEIDRFGGGSAIVRAVPAILAQRDPARLVRRLGDALVTRADAGEMAMLRELTPLDRLAATIACHGATRAGDPLAPLEQEALLADLDAIPWAPCCPHGRPVAVPMPVSEIEARFGRR